MEFSRQSTVGLSKFRIPSVNESRVGLSPKSSVPSTEVQVDVPSSIKFQRICEKLMLTSL